MRLMANWVLARWPSLAGNDWEKASFQFLPENVMWSVPVTWSAPACVFR